MKEFKVTKRIGFCYGHRVPHHASKCRNVHGHEALLEVTVRGPLVPEGDKLSNEGMVMDFSAIKKTIEVEIVSKFDHRFIAAESDDGFRTVVGKAVITETLQTNELGRVYNVKDFGWVQEIKGVPTAENLACVCFDLLSARLNSHGAQIRVTKVRFWETPNSYAEYNGKDIQSAQRELSDANEDA